jgi:hypothetical protein
VRLVDFIAGFVAGILAAPVRDIAGLLTGRVTACERAGDIAGLADFIAGILADIAGIVAGGETPPVGVAEIGS